MRAVRQRDRASRERTVKRLNSASISIEVLACQWITEMDATAAELRRVLQPIFLFATRSSYKANPEETFMKKKEWMRDVVSSWPTPDYIKQQEDAGWRLSAVEWQREVEIERPSESGRSLGEEIPFGTQIATDCLHLEENPVEMQILNSLAEMVVQDLSYARMAEALNSRSFRTREGKPWTSLEIFKLTPRLIEVAPRILSGSEWEARKKQLARVSWNS
jgi:hypothetical protein